MVCPQCQTRNRDGATHCVGCSNELDPRPAAPAPISTTGGAATVTQFLPQPATELPAGTVIGGRYEVIKMLGSGGMGAVYQTLDRELERVVALKVIRPERAADPQVLKRFKQELILTRQISHPNVIQIYDMGNADGFLYISMEYVEGRDLANIVEEKGKLPPEQAADIIGRVCRGLQAAHSENVIHRDMKPQNIMIRGERDVIVMDFGIARSADSYGMTQTGAVIGTPVYMSPEQAMGEKVDTRSDIFSLGIIFYELLTGAVPFRSESAVGTLMKRCREKAVPPIDVDPSVPKPLSDIVARALATDPASRYQTVGELIRDLDRWEAERSGTAPVSRVGAVSWKWLAAILGVLCVVAGELWYTSRPKPPGPPPVQKAMTLLVSDFDNNTGESVFDGTLESMIGVGLEGAAFITSFDRGQAHKLLAQLRPGATRLDLNLSRLVARREGIDGIVTGSVSRDGDGYRLSFRVVDAATGRDIASRDSGKIAKENVLSAVGQLVAPIRKVLGDTAPESRLLNAGETFTSTSLDAVHNYALGQEFQWKGKLAEASRYYSEAIRTDPDFGRAYAGLAAAELNFGHFAEAAKYYREALARTSQMTDREKYRTRGSYYLFIRDDDKAIEEYSTLVREYPADTAGLANLALAYLYRRDITHALEDGRRASEVNPRNVIRRNNLALYLLYYGDFPAAEREARKVLELNPAYEKAFVAIALSQLAQGQLENANETWKRLGTVSRFGASRSADGLSDIALYQGNLRAAASILETAIAADDANRGLDSAAMKRLALSGLRIDQGRVGEGIALAEQALAGSKQEETLFTAAQIYLRARNPEQARTLADKLGSRLEPEARSYAKLVDGELALDRGKSGEAIASFVEAQKLTDTWLAHFLLARAQLEARRFSEALRESELCLKRRGEATSVFLDEVPTYRYLPSVYYFKGRAEEALKNPAASESYRTYLAIKEKAERDSFAADAARRLAALTK